MSITETLLAPYLKIVHNILMEQGIQTYVSSLGEKAKSAYRKLASSGGEQRSQAIIWMKEQLSAIKSDLLKANEADVTEAKNNQLPAPLVKRLTIDEKVFNYMTQRLAEVAALSDPVGRILEGHTNPNGLRVEKVSVPIGVIALIYESRPNVTTDAASVCIKSGNAVILRGGSESLRSNLVLAGAMRKAAELAGLPADVVQIVEKKEHDVVSAMLSMNRYIDLVIPRGGKDLIRKIAEGTSIPVLKHYEGICHIYCAEDAPSDWVLSIVVNSKCQSVEVCNALETLLVDAKAADRLLPLLAAEFDKRGVELRGCEETLKYLPGIKPAVEEDWHTEYLAPILSVKIVDGIDEAVDFINTYGSGHTDGIITMNCRHEQQFTASVDSASVMVNASTRLSGGGEYGLGAVVGISTDKIHARGPVGSNDLTSYKWIARGQGHIRK